MDLVAVLALEMLNGIASLVLISVGLAIIFGMMRVINLAHGEFLMLGGYAAIVATNRGVNIWIAMLVVAPVVVGIIGVIAERLIIRVHHGHQRRDRHHRGHRHGGRALRLGESAADLPDHTRHRGGRSSGRGHLAVAGAAARHHRQAVPGQPVRLRRISPGIVLTAALMVVVGVGGPVVVDQFGLLQLTVFASMCILALSLGVVWGYGGILCFGQSAFFGLGAYTYAVTAINLGESTLAIVLSVVLPGVFAALLGYFMFYGRLSDVYLGVITLSVTLIFFNLMNSTAGDAYRIGSARLNGFNGMPSLPTFNVPGNPGRLLDPTETFYLVMALLLIVYVGLHALLASHFGRVVVAVRENETRCELLGYDVRLHKLLIFTLGGAIAGLAGSLFANWGAFVSPNVFSLGMTSQVIIWVIVGGLGTLGGPIIGCLIMQYLATELGTQQLANTSLIFGIIFLAFVLLVPRGVVPALIAVRARLSGAVRARVSGAPRTRPIA